MGHKKAMLRAIGCAVLLGLLGSPAAAVSAAPAKATHESYSFSGAMADAKWSSDEEPAPGTPRVLALMGADATAIHRVPGAKPVREAQPAVLAWADSAADGTPREVWCVSDAFTFEVAGDLSVASLRMDCLAEVYVYDPATGEEVPTGDTFPLSVRGDWNAIGALESQKSHTRYSVGGAWTMDVSRTSMRPALADITVIGPDGVIFDSTALEASLQIVKATTLTHE